MEYEEDFTKSFMRRTLEIVKEYDGEYDATLIVNCLLGLLIVPKETLIDSIPKDPFEEISSWGISPGSVKGFGRCEYGCEHKPNLRQLVRKLRNSVAHFKVKPIHINGTILGFSFDDRYGFRAELQLHEIRDFVVRLAQHLESNV